MKASLYYYTIWELVKHHSTAASLTWHVQGLWFRRRSKKTSKLRVTGLCAGNSPATGQLPAQMASYVKNVSIWWRHHVICVSKTDPCIMWRKRNLTWFLSEFLWLMKNLEHFCIRQHSKWPTRSREISRHLEDWTSRKKNRTVLWVLYKPCTTMLRDSVSHSQTILSRWVFSFVCSKKKIDLSPHMQSNCLRRVASTQIN